VLVRFDVLLRHSAGDGSRVGIEINGVEVFSGTIVDVPIVPSERIAYGALAVDIPGEQTIDIRGRYQSVDSGTTTAKNPMLLVWVWRTA
jgi:hypothetical protein